MSQAEQDYIFDINDPCNIQYTADGNYQIETSDWAFEGLTVDYVIYFQSTSNPSDTLYAQYIDSVTFTAPACSPDLEIDDQHDGELFQYKIGSTKLTITFDEAENGDCQWTDIIADTNAALPTPFTASWLTFTPATQQHDHPNGPTTSFVFFTYATLDIETSDYSLEGIYDLTYWMTDSSGAQADVSTSFQVQIYDNFCVKGWANVPADNSHDLTYVLDQGDVDITLSGLNNNDCRYEIEILEIDGVTPANTNVINANQPVFQQVGGQADPDVVEVTQDGYLRINTAISLLDGNDYHLIVKLNSRKNSADTVTTQFLLTVSFVLTTCSPALPTSADLAITWPTYYEYKIGTSPFLTIEFSGQ